MKFRPKKAQASATRSKLWQDIIVVLLIKFILLFTLWKISFSDPVEKHLTQQKVQQQFLGDNHYVNR